MTDLTAKDVTISSAVGLTDPTLAIGLNGISDWGTNMPFLNLMDMSRSMFAHATGIWSLYNTEALYEQGYLDENGWPTGIPSDATSIATYFAWSSDPTVAATSAGTYIVEYEGEGTLAVEGGARIVSQEEGRLVVELSGTAWGLKITETDPEGTGNYIKDISIVKEEFLPLREAGAIFNPDYISVVEDTRQIRFMAWMETNGTILGEGDMPLIEADGNWRTSGSGAPLEYLVALANQIGADPWFNIPAGASEDYIRAMGEYIRDNLDPSLTARFEYSNEVWNFAFSQTQWIYQQAMANWSETDGASHIAYHAKLATDAALVLQDVFAETEGIAGRSQPALVNVLGSQAGNNWLTSTLLSAKAWQENDPDNYVDPASVFEEVAVTTYFGSELLSNAENRAEFLDILQTAPLDDVADWLLNRLATSIEARLAGLEEAADIVHAAGLDLVLYEGGQHVLHSFATTITAEEMAVVQSFLTDFIRSDDMAKLYQLLWDGWEAIGDGPFMQFGDVGAASKYGVWAYLQSLVDTNPRAELLDNLNTQSTLWWADTAEDDTYQQGLTIYGEGDEDVVLAGTTKGDFLIGTDADEVFYGGTGNDGIAGFGGEDTLILSGSIAEYTIEPDGDGYRITGPDGSDYITGIEYLNFDDRQEISLAEFIAGNEDRLRQIAIKESGSYAGYVEGALDKSGVIDLSGVEEGVIVSGINRWSDLGKEMGLSGSDTAASYTVSVRSASADFDGKDLSASYWTQQANQASADDPTPIAASATEAAAMLGAVYKEADTFILTDQNDVFLGRDSSVEIDAGAGNDYIAGSGGDDLIKGHSGNNTLLGKAGDDTLVSGSGSDTMTGGAGADHFVMSVGSGKDTIRDLTQEDRIDLGNFLMGTEGVLASLSLDQSGTLVLSNGTDQITFEGLTKDDIPWLLETITGDNLGLPFEIVTKGALFTSEYEETVYLTSQTANGINVDGINNFSSLGKSLELSGTDNAYVVYENDASTTALDGTVVKGSYYTMQGNLTGANGTAVAGSAQEAALSLGSVLKGAAELHLTAYDDRFAGRAADDLIFGGDGNDTLSGGNGHDTLVGESGKDVLSGGKDADTFIFSRGDGVDRVTDFSIEDTVILYNYLDETPLCEAITLNSSNQLVLGNGADSITFVNLTEIDRDWLISRISEVDL